MVDPSGGVEEVEGSAAQKSINFADSFVRLKTNTLTNCPD
jgi:hypothetical protein